MPNLAPKLIVLVDKAPDGTLIVEEFTPEQLKRCIERERHGYR
jgi:hypothetical protein